MLGQVANVSNYNSNSMDIADSEPVKFVRSTSSTRAVAYYDVLSSYKSEIVNQVIFFF